MKRLGPVLQFLSSEGKAWRVSALWVQDTADAAPVLTAGAQAVTVAQAPVPGTACTAWRFEWAVPQTNAAQQASYTIGGATYGFHVPAAGGMPSMGYASCNGFSDPKLMKSVRVPNAMWSRLGRLHNEQDKVDQQTFGPLHLLLLGGDQVYADAMWSVIPELKAWTTLPWDKRVKAKWTDTLQRKMEAYYSNLYLERWSQPEVAAMLATVPTVMMWDDHDIMDGWGSYPQDMHDSPIYQGLFAIARRAFALFQRHALNGVLPPSTLPGQSFHNSGLRIGSLGLLVLDMRSERRPRAGDVSAQGGTLMPDQVLSPKSWTAVYDWLSRQEAAGDMKHLFVMSSIPVVHPSFELLEKLLGVLPGQQELEDDLRDHWTSPPHRAERLRMIHRLLQTGASGSRVTLLSGDVHVAALGVIESSRAGLRPNAGVINQLTSSAVVHPSPGAVVLFFLEQACKHVEQVDRGINGSMLEFPTTTHRMIGARNFLTLQPDAGGDAPRYWANWWVEGEPHPYTKVVHTVG